MSPSQAVELERRKPRRIGGRNRIWEGPEPFSTCFVDAYRRRSETLDALIPQLQVKGLSVRDVSDTFASVFEDEGFRLPPRSPSPPATASRIGQRIIEDFETWRTRSLSGYDVLYFFVDGMYLKLALDRPEKQPVLIAYAILANGNKVLLHIGVGDRESCEACEGFRLPTRSPSVHNMIERGLRPPFGLPPWSP